MTSALVTALGLGGQGFWDAILSATARVGSRDASGRSSSAWTGSGTSLQERFHLLASLLRLVLPSVRCAHRDGA